MNVNHLFLLVSVAVGSFAFAGDEPNRFLKNGVTAHRGNSGDFPENTLPAFKSGIESGVDWIELDLFRTKDGKLVVIHDTTTKRTGDKNLNVIDSSYEELLTVDVATDFRNRTGKSLQQCPAERIALLEDVLRLIMRQEKTRLSIQPKMDCVADAVGLVKRMNAEQSVGFNDSDLSLMSEVKRLAPEIPVFWDRGSDTDIDADIVTAKRVGFGSLVIQEGGITDEKIRKIKAAGLEAGAWTVNDPARMVELIRIGVDKIYTDHPKSLLAIKHWLQPREIVCDGTYAHHLQGICIDDTSIYWSFTTTLAKTDLSGKLEKQIPVADHHGDLCFHDGKVYVAVNLGKFNDPKGKADSWIYVYDANSLAEIARHEIQEVFHGAGGIGYRDGAFYVVGGLPEGIQQNYVYQYDDHFKFVKKHIVESGHTHLGIQSATFAHGRWWFGCYGKPAILLVTDSDFKLLGRYPFDCSLGIQGLPGGGLLSASGQCEKGKGCNGSARVAMPNQSVGLKYMAADQPD
ncbi:MAG TPA: hypothetical protein DDZ51_13940 [Planctomycetaceae bacterium]|nr:hypothetical protein [Planctomycetaceae bacterium]